MRRPRRPKGDGVKAAREHLRLVLGGQEAARKAAPVKVKAQPLSPLLKAAMIPPKKPGGQAQYPDAIRQDILNRMWHGQTLGAICLRPEMPGKEGVFYWTETDPQFRQAYGRARLALADALVEQALEIADDLRGDLTANGLPNTANVLRAKLRVDTRKWAAAKLDPKRWGHLTQELTGEIVHRHMIDRPPNETREQWIARRKAELALPPPDGSAGP